MKWILLIGIIMICLMLLAGYIAISFACKREENDRVLKDLPKDYLEWYQQLQFQDLEIVSDDGLKLRAKYLDNHSDKLLIAVHGYHSNNLYEYAYYLKYYLDMGFNILLPDNRAHGQSEGKWIGFGWLDRLDIMKWIKTMIEKNPQVEIVLHGISMGSATVLNVSGEEISNQVKCIVADCAFTNVYEQMVHVGNTSEKAMKYLLPFANAMSQYVVGYNFKKASPLQQVKKSKTPTLFIHGDKDDYVPTRMGYELYEACSADKKLLIVPGAPHADSYFVNKELCEKTITEFLKKYI